MSAQTETTKVVKTLPIKYKHMLYSMVGLIENLKHNNVLDGDSVQKCLDVLKPAIFMKPDEQVAFMDELIDLQHIEKNIVKGMIAEKKKAEKDQEKAQKKAEKTAILTAEKEKQKAEKAAEKEKQKAEKKPRAKKNKEEPKVEEPKVEEPKVEEPKVEEPKVEEPKVEETKVEEPKVEEVKEAPKVKEPKEAPKVEEPKVEEPKVEPEMMMKIINDVRYWILENNPENSPVYENTKDSDGDSTSGKKVGELRDGELFLDNAEEPKEKKKTVKKPRQPKKDTETTEDKKLKTKGRKPMISHTVFEGTKKKPEDQLEFSCHQTLDFELDEKYTSELTEEEYNGGNTTPKLRVNK